MGVVGDLDRYTRYSTAEALQQGGEASSGLAAGMGAGMGMAMGTQMAQRGPWGATPPPPPPPPVEHVWHVADGGKTTGPFSKAALGRMASDGKLTRETFVWTPGQDGWMRAEDVNELAQLFTVLPPPPPGA